MNTGDLYAACGWSQGCAYWRRKTEDLKLSVIVRVSKAAGIPTTQFIDYLLAELRKPSKSAPRPRRKKNHAARGNAELFIAVAQIRATRNATTRR
jgi:hypothetical protein